MKFIRTHKVRECWLELIFGVTTLAALVATGLHLLSIKSQYTWDVCYEWGNSSHSPDSCFDWDGYSDAILRHLLFAAVAIVAILVIYLIAWYVAATRGYKPGAEHLRSKYTQPLKPAPTFPQYAQQREGRLGE